MPLPSSNKNPSSGRLLAPAALASVRSLALWETKLRVFPPTGKEPLLDGNSS